MLGQHVRRIGTIEPGLCHHSLRQTLARGPFVDPARFADRLARIPLGFDVDRLDYIKPRCVAVIIGQEIGASDRCIVAVAEGAKRRDREPRMCVEAEVPEVMVRIDNGQRRSQGIGARVRHGVRLPAARHRAPVR